MQLCEQMQLCEKDIPVSGLSGSFRRRQAMLTTPKEALREKEMRDAMVVIGPIRPGLSTVETGRTAVLTLFKHNPFLETIIRFTYEAGSLT